MQEDPHYGNCYTFYADDAKYTAPDESHDTNYTAFTGPAYGLRITLYIDEKYYPSHERYKRQSSSSSDKSEQEEAFNKYLDTVTSSIGFRVH